MYNFPVIIVVRRNVSTEKQPQMKNSIFIPVFNKVSAKKVFFLFFILSVIFQTSTRTSVFDVLNQSQDSCLPTECTSLTLLY